MSIAGQPHTIQPRRPLPIVPIVFGIAMCAVVLYLFLVQPVLQSMAARKWTETPCVIMSNHRIEQSNGGHHVTINYSYKVDGRGYLSAKLQFLPGTSSGNDALAVQYPAGRHTVCYVNPANPADAVLNRDITMDKLAGLSPLPVFLLIIAMMVFLATRRVERSPVTGSRQLSPGAGIACSLLVLAMALAFLYFVTIRPGSLVLAAQKWVPTPCQIESSQVGTHSGRHGATYSVDITYSYLTGGRPYTSDRYEFLGGSSSGYSGKAQIVNRYPPGSRSICYVDPADPSSAVIQRSFTTEMILLSIVALLFTVLGIAGFVSTLRGKPWTVSNR